MLHRLVQRLMSISRGGGREPDANGTYQRKKDYKPSSLRFWENAKELNQPVVVVAGKCSLSGINVPSRSHTYRL